MIYKRYEEYKESGIEWIGEIPRGWNVCRFKQFCEVKDGTHDTPKYIDKSKQAYPFITSKDINNGKISFKDCKYINCNDYKEINKRSNVEKNDVVMPMIGTVGNPAIVSTNIKFSIKNLALFKTRNNINKAKYILYILNSYIIKEQIGLLTRGGVQNFISLNILQNLYLINPRLDLDHIITFLDKKTSEIDSLINEKENLIELLKEERQAIITEVVTKGLDKNVEMKDSGVEWIGKIPKHWSCIKIKYIFDIIKQIARKTGFDILSVTQKGLKIKDISKNDGQIAIDYSKYQKVKINDFVMNHMDLLTGWVDCSPYNGVTSPDYRVFRLKNKLENSNEYFKFIMQICYLNKSFYSLGQGVSNLGRWRLQTDKFKEFIVPVPPKSEQYNIIKYLKNKCDDMDITESKVSKQIELLKEYKQSLISEVVTGKIDVRDL